MTDAGHNAIKGVKGFVSLPVEQRFWAKVEKTNGCWNWIGSTTNGYGYIYIDGVNRRAHRVSYEWAYGPPPKGMDLDHLCRNRACVRPDHLEAVTRQENLRRAPRTAFSEHERSKTHCRNGHPFTPENTYSPPSRPHSRRCRECSRANTKSWRARAALESNP